MKTEKDLQMAVCLYIKLQYPDVIFHSDFSAGLKMSIGMAVRNKKMQSSRGFPDLIICEPRNGYHGLLLELKNGYSKVYKKDGQLKNDIHVHEQAAMLADLRNKGYLATFATSFEEAKEIIDMYMSINK